MCGPGSSPRSPMIRKEASDLKPAFVNPVIRPIFNQYQGSEAGFCGQKLIRSTSHQTCWKMKTAEGERQKKERKSWGRWRKNRNNNSIFHNINTVVTIRKVSSL